MSIIVPPSGDPQDDVECICEMTPEHMWLSAASCGYGSGYEPGSQWEWNPDCPAHPPYDRDGGVA